MMYLGRGGVNRIRRLVSSDQWAGLVADEILQRARVLHGTPLVAWAYQPGLEVILPVSRSLAERVHTFGMAWFLDGDPTHRQRLLAELNAAAGFPGWNPTHFLDTAEMMAGVAIGRDWLGTLMTATERSRIDKAIVDYGLTPALSALREGTFWTHATHNWNVVCCGGAIIAAVAMRREQPALCDQIIELASEAITHGLSSYAPDGGYPEGPSYWEYATRYAALAIAALEDAGLDYLGLAAQPGLVATWRYSMAMTSPAGLQFDYGDNLLAPDPSPVLGWLARKSGDIAATDWQRRAPGPQHPFDLVWYEATALQPAVDEPIAFFAKAGVVALTDRAAAQDWYVGVKGGDNSVNHSHLDLGTFVLEARGKRFVSELGRDDYALPGYFDLDRRYKYLRTGTPAHNTVVFGNRNQALSAHAKCLDLRSDSDMRAAAFVVIDPDAPCLLRRAVALLRGRGVAVIDHIFPKQGTSDLVAADWRFHTKAKVECQGIEAVLRLGETELKLRLVAPFSASFEQEDVPTPPGEADNRDFTRVLVRFVVPPDGVRMAVIFDLETPGIDNLSLHLHTLHDWLDTAGKDDATSGAPI